MYKKAIVMEIKAAYAIAMEEGGSIIRIKKKDGLSVGDSIYVLPEDLYQGQEACSDSSLHRFPRKLVPFPGIKKSSLVKIASIAAMLILCITLAIPQLTVTTYAQASFDGAGSIQLSLDRNLQIIKAVSPDQSVSDSVLKALHGKHINEVGNTLRSACGFGDVLVGYALTSEKEDASSLDQELRALFPPHSVTFINGTSQDIENAEKESLSLGKYLTSQQDKDRSDEPENSDSETSEQDKDETEQETDTPEQDEDETEQETDTPEQDETERDSDTPEQDETERDSDTPEQDEDKTEQDSDTLKQDEIERDLNTPEQDETERDSDASDSTDAPESEDRPESSPEDSNSDSESEQPEPSEREEHSSSREENSRSDEDSDSEENSDSEEEEE